MIKRTGVVEEINGNVRKSWGRILGQWKPEVKSKGHALVVNRDGDSWFCLEQLMEPEIGEGIIHIWLKITAESDGSDCSYQRQWTGWKWHYWLVLVLKVTGWLCINAIYESKICCIAINVLCGWQVGVVRVDEFIHFSTDFLCHL